MAHRGIGNGGMNNGEFLAWLQGNLIELRRMADAAARGVADSQVRTQNIVRVLGDLEKTMDVRTQALLRAVQGLDRRVTRLERGRAK